VMTPTSSCLSMHLQVPTPCSAKRSMDEEHLCHRFQKRLRLEGDLTDADVLAAYDGVNFLLRSLHSEQVARRQAQVGAMHAERQANTTACSVHGGPVSQYLPQMLTSFTLADVVYCNHGIGGRCLHCSGRLVQNVPLALYSSYCSAFMPSSLSPSSSPPSSSSPSSSSAKENLDLSFPALVSLIANLAPQPGERLLHLRSGTGKLIVAWVLLIPCSVACGVEDNLEMHRAAAFSVSSLEVSASQRLHLHNADIFSSQGDWPQAGTIMLNATSLSDDALVRIVAGLQNVSAGTRVVSFSRPLCTDPGAAPRGFVLVRCSLYRLTGPGNCTVYFYRRLNVC